MGESSDFIENNLRESIPKKGFNYGITELDSDRKDFLKIKYDLKFRNKNKNEIMKTTKDFLKHLKTYENIEIIKTKTNFYLKSDIKLKDIINIKLF